MNWLQKHKQDIYVKKAKKEGYLTRASFKLIQIEKKFKFISNSNHILELGSSPGGWSQVICNINNKTLVHAFDVLEMKYNNPRLKFFKQNCVNFNFKSFKNKYDLILSDLAPNTTGHKSTDHLRIASIIIDIIDQLDDIALPKSNFIFKIWKGSEEKNILNHLKKQYKRISYFKPSSSRIKSSEIFIVAENFIV